MESEGSDFDSPTSMPTKKVLGNAGDSANTGGKKSEILKMYLDLLKGNKSLQKKDTIGNIAQTCKVTVAYVCNELGVKEADLANSAPDDDDAPAKKKAKKNGTKSKTPAKKGSKKKQASESEDEEEEEEEEEEDEEGEEDEEEGEEDEEEGEEDEEEEDAPLGKNGKAAPKKAAAPKRAPKKAAKS